MRTSSFPWGPAIFIFTGESVAPSHLPHVGPDAESSPNHHLANDNVNNPAVTRKTTEPTSGIFPGTQDQGQTAEGTAAPVGEPHPRKHPHGAAGQARADGRSPVREDEEENTAANPPQAPPDPMRPGTLTHRKKNRETRGNTWNAPRMRSHQ